MIADTSTAITLRREMLASLHDRLYTPPTRDDLKWRDFAEAATSVSAAANWKTMYERYSREDALGLTDALPADLPEEWVVLSLHLAADRQSLVAVRRQAKEPPLILQLPLDRLGHREGEEELLNFWAASTEMMDIIAGANETAQRAKHCVTQEARAAWWKERKSLDRRLAELLVNIETRWFGAFIVSTLMVCLLRVASFISPSCSLRFLGATHSNCERHPKQPSESSIAGQARTSTSQNDFDDKGQ